MSTKVKNVEIVISEDFECAKGIRTFVTNIHAPEFPSEIYVHSGYAKYLDYVCDLLSGKIFKDGELVSRMAPIIRNLFASLRKQVDEMRSIDVPELNFDVVDNHCHTTEDVNVDKVDTDIRIIRYADKPIMGSDIAKVIIGKYEWIAKLDEWFEVGGDQVSHSDVYNTLWDNYELLGKLYTVEVELNRHILMKQKKDTWGG